MTDVIVVDDEGRFSIGKASTSPHDQSVGYLESLRDGFDNWGMDFDSESESILAGVDAIVYAGTAMLNALITGTGSKVGVILRRGDEDIFIHQRVSQSSLGLANADNQDARRLRMRNELVSSVVLGELPSVTFREGGAPR